MKRLAATVLSVMLLMTVVFGFTGCKNPKKEWYKNCLEYYRDGIKNGFTQSFGNLQVPDELKDKNNHGKSVNDLGWCYFVNRLKTKADEQGKIVIEANK